LATLSTFREALYGDPGRLDRDVWLARLADLLIDADIPPGCAGLLERSRAALRDGEAQISLRGYSHVFVHNPDASVGHPASSEQNLIDQTDGVQAWQEVFERAELRSLVEAYAAKEDPVPVRVKLGPEEPWASSAPRPPAARVSWTLIMDSLASGSDQAIEEASTVQGTSSFPEGSVNATAETVCPSTTPSSGVITPSPAPIATAAPTSKGDNLAALVASKVGGQTGAVDEREAWAVETTKKLKTALNRLF
jgi:S-DNA-T family DNA segregation ATPase FtsK/SpoIIIE